MIITRELLKTEIDKVAEQDLEALHRIVQALNQTTSPAKPMNAVGWSTFVKQMYGSLADDPIVRGPQGDFEARENIQ